MGDAAEALQEQVAQCHRQKRSIGIFGHGSKGFLGDAAGDVRLETTGYAGIIDYRPEELVVTARAGTPLVELTDALAEQGQLLPFDPPRYGHAGTLGGAIASGLSGPARPWRGSVRDAVLGVEIVNGMGERLRFGGSVMKNVAGYDISRLMAGARGRFGVILSASVRVAPKPPAEATLRLACPAARAGELCRSWARLPLPITATCWVDGVLHVRLSGSESGIASACASMELQEASDSALWPQVRDHDHPFFRNDTPLVRLSLPRGNRFAAEDALLEWGGCQAWLRREGDDEEGFAMAFRGGGTQSAPADGTAKYARRVKQAFDPAGILNPGLGI